jgi:hypothetical protein
MAASSFAPVAGRIRVIDGYNVIQKLPISKRQRSYPSGSPMWLNKISANYIAEPAGVNCINATVDCGLGGTASAASTYAALTNANAAFAPLFLGFAGEARIPQQFLSPGNFNQPGPVGTVPLYADDASRPFIPVYREGIAEAPLAAALTTALEIGNLVQVNGFLNEAASGFYDPTGTGSGAGGFLQLDTKYYLYNNSVIVSTTAADAIGVVCERAPIGATVVRFRFKSAIESIALGGV